MTFGVFAIAPDPSGTSGDIELIPVRPDCYGHYRKTSGLGGLSRLLRRKYS
ncbi:hypothetical protein CCANI_02905 [Corynebacterium canis]|nr:hypothetical protein CCANI_02905 [Corynebacterium canis]